MERFAVVTGASAGIGRATALLLARARWSMMLSGRDGSRLTRIARACVAQGAGPVYTSALDLRVPEQVTRLSAAVAAETNVVHGLVNVAGTGRFAPLSALDLTEVVEMVSINTVAPWMLTKMLLPLLRRAQPIASVVNITSDAAYFGFPDASGYCASKAGLAGLSRSLQMELREQGIRLTMVAPGRVDTTFNSRKVGDRLGALAAEEVAEVVQFCIECSPNIDLTEVRLDSMSRN